MKKNINPNLLNEELKKFRLLSEYDFYTEKKEAPTFNDSKELVLGNKPIGEVDEDPTNPEAANNDVDSAANNVAADLGVDPNDGGEEVSADIPEPDMAPDEDMPEPDMTPAGDEVEVDVTSLVKGSEEAKDSADRASQNTEMLLQKLSDLESRMASMVAISDKIEGLEKEIIKRNPTPVEKLEMRSLDSYPFNQKLSDYWSDKEGAYDVMGKSKPKEYVLTKDDVDSTFSDNSIQKSFTDIKDYEEEDISGYSEENI